MTKKGYDIRTHKNNLRDQQKKLRQKMDSREKADCDARIRGRILHLPEYTACKTLLCYVSTPIEVDTRGLIVRAIADGKTVAAPRCVDGRREMHFYRIRSLDELKLSAFGIPEPDPATAERVTDYAGSLCILPGFAFDHAGYRLGYGGGYYDRFLSKVYRRSGVTAGICYTSCVKRSLPHGYFDVPCDILITEKYAKWLLGTKKIHENRF